MLYFSSKVIDFIPCIYFTTLDQASIVNTQREFELNKILILLINLKFNESEYKFFNFVIV